MKLKVDHPYYCHCNNFFSNDVYQEYNTVDEFLSEFNDADIDMNLVFRFDVKENYGDNLEHNGTFYCMIFMIMQRKGIFKPIMINTYTENDEQKMIAYLERHWEKLNELWIPISNGLKGI